MEYKFDLHEKTGFVIFLFYVVAKKISNGEQNLMKKPKTDFSRPLKKRFKLLKKLM